MRDHLVNKNSKQQKSKHKDPLHTNRLSWTNIKITLELLIVLLMRHLYKFVSKNSFDNILMFSLWKPNFMGVIFNPELFIWFLV